MNILIELYILIILNKMERFTTAVSINNAKFNAISTSNRLRKLFGFLAQLIHMLFFAETASFIQRRHILYYIHFCLKMDESCSDWLTFFQNNWNIVYLICWWVIMNFPSVSLNRLTMCRMQREDIGNMLLRFFHWFGNSWKIVVIRLNQ